MHFMSYVSPGTIFLAQKWITHSNFPFAILPTAVIFPSPVILFFTSGLLMTNKLFSITVNNDCKTDWMVQPSGTWGILSKRLHRIWVTIHLLCLFCSVCLCLSSNQVKKYISCLMERGTAPGDMNQYVFMLLTSDLWLKLCNWSYTLFRCIAEKSV